MKKVALVLLICAFSGLALAQSKVAVINVQAAMLQTDVAQKKLQALESNADYAAMQSKFEALRADLEALGKDAQTNQLTWSDDQKQEFNKKVEYKRADLKLAAEKIKAERTAVVQKILQELTPKARAAVNEVVTAEGISVLFDSGAAVYVAPDANLTDKVTAKLNNTK